MKYKNAGLNEFHQLKKSIQYWAYTILYLSLGHLLHFKLN